MADAPRIESDNLSIAQLFQDFYSVPDFQREYVWKKSNVEKLLEDVLEELYDEGEPKNNAEYFLGSIVVFRDESGTFQLIDGQQRLTSIYITFCAIRDLLEEMKEKSRVIENFISGVAQDLKTGQDIEKVRVSLQYDAGKKALLSIVEKKKGKNKNFSQEILSSVKHLTDAYEVVKDFISEKFIQSPEHILKFSSEFANKVKLIRIQTLNLKSALKVFETINDRGLGLNSMDLLKNYLFINTGKTDSSAELKSHWQNLKERWDKLTKNLHKCDEKPMRFLRYYIMSHYKVDLKNNFPEEDIYDWFMAKETEHQINKNPCDFVDKLIEASEHYFCFIKSENIDGSSNAYLKNITKIRGKYRQHFILLLAGRYLEKDLFHQLCYWSENLLFIYTITRSTRKDVNMIRSFSQWSEDIRAIKNQEEFDSFINKSLRQEINSLSSDFNLSFREFTDRKIAKYRLRYVLGKITQYVDEEAYGTKRNLDEYLDKSVTIEHILPKTPNTEIKNQFDRTAEYDFYTSKLGNLLLLEKPINSSIADSSFANKKSGYKQSQFLLVRSLVEDNQVGNNTQINRAVKSLNLKQFDKWELSDIDRRQQMLVELARKVWGLKGE